MVSYIATLSLSLFVLRRFHYHFNDHALLPSSSLSSDFFLLPIFLLLAVCSSSLPRSLFPIALHHHFSLPKEKKKGSESEKNKPYDNATYIPYTRHIISSPKSHAIVTCQCNMYCLVSPQKTLPQRRIFFTSHVPSSFFSTNT